MYNPGSLGRHMTTVGSFRKSDFTRLAVQARPTESKPFDKLIIPGQREGVWCHKSKSLGLQKYRSLVIVSVYRIQVGQYWMMNFMALL